MRLEATNKNVRGGGLNKPPPSQVGLMSPHLGFFRLIDFQYMALNKFYHTQLFEIPNENKLKIFKYCIDYKHSEKDMFFSFAKSSLNFNFKFNFAEVSFISDFSNHPNPSQPPE